MDLNLAHIAITALNQLGFSWLVGVLLVLAWMRRENAPWNLAVGLQLRNTIGPVSVLCIFTVLAAQWCQAATVSDSTLWEAGPAFVLMLQSTRFGHAALAGFFAYCAIGVIHFAVRRSHLPIALNAVLLGIVAIAKVLVSHAAENGLVSLSVVFAWLHLALTSVWVGLVCVSGWLVLSPSHAEQFDTDKFLKSLSDCATIALAGIVLTGLINTLPLPWNSAVLDKPYTELLLLKVVLVVLAAALGGFNRFAVLPELLSPMTPVTQLRTQLNRFVLVLRIESAVLVTALVIATALAATSRP